MNINDFFEAVHYDKQLEDWKKIEEEDPDNGTEEEISLEKGNRTGLIPVKVTVHRGGKVFEAIRMKRPSDVKDELKVLREGTEKTRAVRSFSLILRDISDERLLDMEKKASGGSKKRRDILKLRLNAIKIEKLRRNLKGAPERIKPRTSPWSPDTVKEKKKLGEAGGLWAKTTFVVMFEDGSKAVYKFETGEERNELAMYEISNALGWDTVPEVQIQDLKNGIGSVMAWVKGKTGDAYYNSEGSYSDLLKTKERRLNIYRMVFLDYISGNQDRHGGNWMVDKDYNVRAIDNGFAFMHHNQFSYELPFLLNNLDISNEEKVQEVQEFVDSINIELVNEQIRKIHKTEVSPVYIEEFKRQLNKSITIRRD